MFSSYLIPLSSVDADTPPVEEVVGISMAALVGLIIVVIVAVVGFIVFIVIVVAMVTWKEKNSGTLDLKTDVSMKCSMQTPYCVLQEFVCIWHKTLSNICIIK